MSTINIKQESPPDQDTYNNEEDNKPQSESISDAISPKTPTTTTATTTSTSTRGRKKKVDSGSTTKDKPKAFTIKYKRPRGSRACTVCRSRKVRCDAEIHIPCTNCITFGCDCVLPEAKKRGNKSGESKNKKQKLDKDDLIKEEKEGSEELPDHNHAQPATSASTSTIYNEPILNISQKSVPPSLTSSYKNRPSIHKKELMSSKSKPSLTFIGSSSVFVVPQKVGENHVQLTEDMFDVTDNSLDSVELEILKMRGAFLLPSNELALDLIEAYFEHVHPLMPVINKTLFMKKFNDPNDSPSLMVLHAVLLCGSRVSKNPMLFDAKGSADLASLTFFRRAKALYETNYESDPVSIIQTLILIGTYWDGPEDVTKNSFYWTRVAVGLAQGFGFQRDVSKSQSLSSSEKKIWRRIWWCLFEKDRNVAIAFGRPVVIDLNDCDVPMLVLDDFNEDDADLGIKSPYPVNELHALYFIQLVKLAEISGIIIKHQYSVKSESMKRKNAFSIIEHCDMLMGIWFTNLPPTLVFSLADNASQNFYACLLNAQYYNRLYLIHRSNLIRMARSSSTNPNNYKYPSWGISFQSARMISIISKILLDRNLIQYVPTMYVYIAFSALVMLIYHVDSTNAVIASTAADSLYVSRAVLSELAKYWPIAGLLMRLFDKYANDKIKRASVIENGTKLAEYKEIVAKGKENNTSPMSLYGMNQNSTQMSPTSQHPLPPPPPQQQQHQQQQQLHQQQQQQQQKQNSHLHSSQQKGSMFSPSAQSVTSGVSPGSHVYNDYNQQQQVAPSHSQPQIEELIQQYKIPMKRAANGQADGSDKPTTNETSPTSSSQSFPDISLVTENLPSKQNFFENFEPSQLFPTFSVPPTRAQSPSHLEDGNIGSNIYNNSMNQTMLHPETEQPSQQQQQPEHEVQPTQSQNYQEIQDSHQSDHHQHPSTPGFQTNFIDSSFINMNLQAGIDMNDDFSSFFNFMN